MEIIAELEKEARHAYAGAIGYFSFSGNMDTCITIRTIIIHNGKAYVQAGQALWQILSQKWNGRKREKSQGNVIGDSVSRANFFE